MSRELLKEFRKRSGLFQDEIASELGLSLQGYRLKEWGKSHFTIEEMVRLVELFEMSYTEMCDIFFDGILSHLHPDADIGKDCTNCTYRVITTSMIDQQEKLIQNRDVFISG